MFVIPHPASLLVEVLTECDSKFVEPKMDRFTFILQWDGMRYDTIEPPDPIGSVVRFNLDFDGGGIRALKT